MTQAQQVKTPLTHPYSYDPFVTYSTGEKADGTIYTDRLLQWDYDKHNQLCLKHFGDKAQCWAERDPKAIEAFLQDWMSKPDLKLVLIEQHCNLANGFPIWRFDYATKG